MRRLLTALLLLLSFAASAQDWPYNPQTDQVEFRAVLPWPASVKTERQRQALVRRWYEAKLSPPVPSQAPMPLGAATTYANLDKRAAFIIGSGTTRQLLVYMVSITPNPKGITVVLSDFKIGRGGEDETPLEAHIRRPAKNEQATLAVLRKRLAVALAGWN